MRSTRTLLPSRRGEHHAHGRRRHHSSGHRCQGRAGTPRRHLRPGRHGPDGPSVGRYCVALAEATRVHPDALIGSVWTVLRTNH